MTPARLGKALAWGGALALTLSATAAMAQDGAKPVGPPVTRPRTNETAPTTTPATANPKTTSDILPAIPSTARDPAPPGTLGARVDTPDRTAPIGTLPPGGAVAPGGPGAPGTGTGVVGRGANARVFSAEGVVTRIDRAGKAVNGELERFAFDPSQDWFSYVNRGATGVPEKDEDRPKTTKDAKAANEKQHEDQPDKPKVMEMVITRRTYVYAYARSADGTDQYGAATSSTPDTTSSRSGQTNRVVTAAPTGPMRTNFTNLKEGSFVAVRYRKVGDLNEVLNLTLIEMPLNPDAATPPPSATAPGRVGTAPGRGTGPAGTTATPVRVPTVPLQPVGADLPR